MGIDFALASLAWDVEVLTGFLVTFWAMDKFFESAGAAEFALVQKFSLAWGVLLFFAHVHPKDPVNTADPKSFWNVLASLENLLLICIFLCLISQAAFNTFIILVCFDQSMHVQ